VRRPAGDRHGAGRARPARPRRSRLGARDRGIPPRRRVARQAARSALSRRPARSRWRARPPRLRPGPGPPGRGARPDDLV